MDGSSTKVELNFFRECVCACVCVHCFNIFCLCTESMNNWYLSRRMFLVDALSGREKSMSALPKVIRVASSVKIRWAPNVHNPMIKRKRE